MPSSMQTSTGVPSVRCICGGEHTELEHGPAVEPRKQIAVETANHQTLARVTARRRAKGLEVTVTGGQEIVDVFYAASLSAGYSSPYRLPLPSGLDIWNGGANGISRAIGWNFSAPNVPVLGLWILTLDGIRRQTPEEPFVFTLSAPHSKEFVIRTLAEIRDAARSVHSQYGKPFMVKQEITA